MKETKKTNTANPPPVTYDWSQAGMSGFEGTRSEDLGIPFLLIVQKGSPEVDKTHSDYATKKILGVEVGSIINSVSRKVLNANGPVTFIPCFHKRMFVEWKPRDSGGGMVRQHSDDSILSKCNRNDKNQDVLPNSNLIVTTSYMFGMLQTEEGLERAVISFSSTQLKKSRIWLNIAMNLKVTTPDGCKVAAPLFSHKYHLNTTPEQNDAGSWMGWTVEVAGPITDESTIPDLIQAARDASKQNTQIPEKVTEDNLPI